MYSITQVKKNDFPSKGGKHSRTPPLKGLGRVQTIVVPYKTDEEDVSTSLIIEACKVASRISILNGETKKIGDCVGEEVAKEIVPIEEDDLKNYLEHVLPLNNHRVRKFLVGRAKYGEQSDVTETCHSSGTTNETCKTIIHDWSEDKLDKYTCKLHGRDLRHIIFTHPCQHGNIDVDLTEQEETSASGDAVPRAPPMPSTDPNTRLKALSAATNSLLQNKNKSVPFMNELIRKISACQIERPLSSESIEERVERMRNEKIAIQQQKRQEQLEEYNKLIQETKTNLQPAKEIDNKEDNEDEDDDSLLSHDEENDVAESTSSKEESSSQEEEDEEEEKEETCFCLFFIEILKDLGPHPSVNLLGDFNNWEMSNALKLKKVGKSNTYSVVTRLKPGEYQYKYFVNGEWIADERKKTVMDEKTGVLNNVVKVNSSGDMSDEETSEIEESDQQKQENNDESSSDYEEESSDEEENSDEENVSDEEKKSEDEETNESDQEKTDSEKEEINDDSNVKEEEKETDEEEEEEEEEEKVAISQKIHSNMQTLIKEDHFKPTIVKQFCADFYLVICESRDEFSFFTKFDCPYILQWVDETHTAIHIFRRYPLHYYTWTLKRKTQQNYQLLATLETIA